MCPRNSQCIHVNGQEDSHSCQCLPGYTGTDCTAVSVQRTGREVETCSAANCSDNGECVLNSEGFTCNCFKDYTGLRCETTQHSHVGADASGFGGGDCTLCVGCSENGWCTETEDSTSCFCKCLVGYVGENCDAVATTTQTDSYYLYATDKFNATSTSMLNTATSSHATDIIVITVTAAFMTKVVSGAVAAPVVTMAAVTVIAVSVSCCWGLRRKKKGEMYVFVALMDTPTLAHFN